jgi:hypothetical protein
LPSLSAQRPSASGDGVAGGRGSGWIRDRALLGRANGYRQALLRLLRTVVAADGDLFAADLYLDSAILDFPVAHGALFRLHDVSPLKIYRTQRSQRPSRAIHEDMVTEGQKSDFQILAHFAKHSAAGVAAHVGGRKAELVAEDVCEVAVAGKAKFEGEPGEIVRSVRQLFERRAEA